MSDLSMFLTVTEAATAAGVHHDTIRKRISAGALTEYRVRNNALRIDPAELATQTFHPGKTFWEKVAANPSGCWLWTGELVKGYGHHGGRLAHRLAYEEMVGEIPEGLELDHLCVTPACVNAYHLEPVTRIENMRRRAARATHCPNGHEYAKVGRYYRPDNDGWRCRECVREQSRAYRERRAGRIPSP